MRLRSCDFCTFLLGYFLSGYAGQEDDWNHREKRRETRRATATHTLQTRAYANRLLPPVTTANSNKRATDPIWESSVDYSIIFWKFNEATTNMRISKSAMTATSSGRSARLPVIISPRTASTAYVSGLKTATIWMARGINAIG